MKCPECGEEIDHLVNVESGSMEYDLHKDGEYEEVGFLANGMVNDYLCPECNETLFYDEDDALTFIEEV